MDTEKFREATIISNQISNRKTILIELNEFLKKIPLEKEFQQL